MNDSSGVVLTPFMPMFNSNSIHAFANLIPQKISVMKHDGFGDKRVCLEADYGQNTVVILNKSDLEAKVDKKEILEIMECPVIETSALNEDGLEELEKVITDIFFSNRFENKDEVYITNQRQLDSLRKASRSLAFVIESIENSMSEDLFSSDLMDAYSFLGDIIGEDTDDDLADRIFSDFCMGK